MLLVTFEFVSMTKEFFKGKVQFKEIARVYALMPGAGSPPAHLTQKNSATPLLVL